MKLYQPYQYIKRDTMCSIWKFNPVTDENYLIVARVKLKRAKGLLKHRTKTNKFVNKLSNNGMELLDIVTGTKIYISNELQENF